MVPVGPAAEEEGHVPGDQIPARKPGEFALHRHLAEMVGQAADLVGQARGLRNVDEQIVDRRGADGVEHFLPIGVGER